MANEQDKELLELAAKAAGLCFRYTGVHCMAANPKNDFLFWRFWNPLKDDGDAFRLQVMLDMTVTINRVDNLTEVTAGYSEHLGLVKIVEPHGDDMYAASRRAIVCAAAELGRVL